MNPMLDKLSTLWPEMTLLAGACVCMLAGLSGSAVVRRSPRWIAAVSLLLAGLCVATSSVAEPRHTGAALVGVAGLAVYVKMAIVAVGLLLLLIASQVPDRLRQTQDAEAATGRGGVFDPAGVMRGEFFAFFLLSLCGAMLCAGAEDLVWLFLALELTSLPTYVMVATSRDRAGAQESAVKYFFLGAMAAAVFLYGFALIYGATGSTQYDQIAAFVHAQSASGQALPPLFIVGLVLAVVGVSFKIAAVPMHFYAADVYQGAAGPVTAFLAFVPKTAGFVSLIGLLGPACQANAEQLQPVIWLLWIMAVLSMTVGNTLGLLQHNVKRVLAYSSIAHSGYMLVGLIAAVAAATTPGAVTAGEHLGNGVAALLFYLVAYGLATLGAFAVLGCVTTDQGDEAQTYDDIAGLGQRHPLLGVIMLISVLSLVGLPPMVGFLGKIYLFGSAIQHGYIWLVIIAVLNSAISAVYYLRIIGACYFAKPNDQTQVAVSPAVQLGALVAAVGAVMLGVAGGRLVDAARDAAAPPDAAVVETAPLPDGDAESWSPQWADTSVKW